MIIDRILNNNVITTFEDGIEKVVMGTGLGYKKKVGDLVDEEKIQKTFSLANPDINQRFQQLIIEIPAEYIKLSEEIIHYTKTQLGKHLNDTIYISLMDHIYTAAKRYEEGIHIVNPLLWEVKRYYKDEYAIGLHALEMINSRLNIQFSEEEAGSIALHITNAELDGEVENIFEITKIMQEITNHIKYFFRTIFDEDSINYYRFITHLKFFVQRIVTNSLYESEDDGLLEVIKDKYPNSYACVELISERIKKNHKYNISNEEKLYLTIHIEKIVYKSSKK